MAHVDQHTLELFVLDAPEVGAQRHMIESHLAECPGCKALKAEIEEYHEEVQSLRQQRTMDNPEAVTARHVIARIPRFHGDRQQLSRPARVVVFMVRHPVATLGAIAVLFALLVLTLLPRAGISDRNPAYARAQNEFVVVYNSQGAELWRKHIGPGYDLQGLKARPLGMFPDRYLATLDVDADGMNEVVAIPGVLGPAAPEYRTVFCYGPDGAERWRFAQHGKMTFGQESFADDFIAQAFMAAPLGRSRKTSIAALSSVLCYYPACLALLSGVNGSVEGCYWHPGVVMTLDRHDVDGDGTEEILLGGQNNGFSLASLAVLDPDVLEGHAPAPASHTPANVPPGREKFYILFPRSDLGAFAVNRSARVVGLSYLSPGHLMATVAEDFESRTVPLLFHFDSSMVCTRVEAEDTFVVAHRQLKKEGKLKAELNVDYFEALRREVQYWDGSRFVKVPATNKLYVEKRDNVGPPGSR